MTLWWWRKVPEIPKGWLYYNPREFRMGKRPQKCSCGREMVCPPDRLGYWCATCDRPAGSTAESPEIV